MDNAQHAVPELWQRPLWRPGDELPFVFLVVYGVTDIATPVDGKRYRTRGLPDSVDAHSFPRAQHAEYLSESFEEGYAWEAFIEKDPELAAAVRESPGAMAFLGDVSDATSLLYLRDVIGMTAYLLDHGGIAVYDPITFRWFRPDDWRERYFEPDAPQPRGHVMIFYSQEPDGIWFHTRGLLLFGRPEISLRGVPDNDFGAAGKMINELIDSQAAGTFLGEGQIVHDPALGDFIVRYEGDRDDPDFNNVHVELVRPRA